MVDFFVEFFYFCREGYLNYFNYIKFVRVFYFDFKFICNLKEFFFVLYFEIKFLDVGVDWFFCFFIYFDEKFVVFWFFCEDFNVKVFFIRFVVNYYVFWFKVFKEKFFLNFRFVFKGVVWWINWRKILLLKFIWRIVVVNIDGWEGFKVFFREVFRDFFEFGFVV